MQEAYGGHCEARRAAAIQLILPLICMIDTVLQFAWAWMCVGISLKITVET